MAGVEISDHRVKLGQRILAALDRAGLLPESAFWVYSRRQKRWTFLAVSSLVDEFGRQAVYQNVMRAYPAMDWPKSFGIFGLQVEPLRRSSTAAPILAAVRPSMRGLVDVPTAYGDELAVWSCRLNAAPRGAARAAQRRAFREAMIASGSRRRLLRAA